MFISRSMTASVSMNDRFSFFATKRATVVFPTPIKPINAIFFVLSVTTLFTIYCAFLTLIIVHTLRKLLHDPRRCEGGTGSKRQRVLLLLFPLLLVVYRLNFHPLLVLLLLKYRQQYLGHERLWHFQYQ